MCQDLDPKIRLISRAAFENLRLLRQGILEAIYSLAESPTN